MADSMELEPYSGDFQPMVDRRPLVPEPLPVRLLVIDDVELPAASGLETQLERFYVDLFGFERDQADPHALVLRADNARLRFAVLEPPIIRDNLRTIGIEVPKLGAAELTLVDAKIPYVRQRGLMPGQDALSLQDPAGNWLAITEIQLFR